MIDLGFLEHLTTHAAAMFDALAGWLASLSLL